MRWLVTLAIIFAAIVPANAQQPSAAGAGKTDDKPLPTIAEKTKAMKALPGYFPLYWDQRTGKLWLEIDKFNTEFLYLDSLPAGMGSNDIGLDRGQLGESRVVRFERVGPKVLLVQLNYDYRSSSNDPVERSTIEDAFAKSVLAGFEVSAEEGDRVLVDATNFYLADAHKVADTLKRTKQGSFRLDPSRSAIYLPRTRNFPQNTEVESTLTFTGDDPGRFVRQVTPDPNAITVREHYSFIQLPDNNYKPRPFDPRAGYFDVNFMDYSTPIGEPIVHRYIARHRLEKKDPSAAVSEPVKPIVYYLDPGTPEPVRSALLDGARWWAQAFEAAGFKNAFRVEMLPPDADPMDVRYNVIQWVHRATRGWSYGAAVTDPRTGEIIQGHVTLGSLRVRQDYMIFEGLLAPYKNGKKPDPRMLQMALARLRQLAAHELGHTLGLAHNYIASTEGRASVMDYPHPLIKLNADGSFDTSDAYTTSIGEWDKVAIQYGYSQFAPGTDEHAALNKIIDDARKRGLTFLSDQDARPTGSASPVTHLWDNGKNAVDELDRVMQVRAKALSQFGEENIKNGEPLAELSDVLVPIYLFHRYQTEAAAKSIGGLNYTYALRGDGQTPTAPVPATEQRRALAALLKTISPEALALPDKLVALMPPHPAGYPRTQESFPGDTGLTFDPLGAANTAANMTVSLLLDPERATRLIEHHAADAQQPSLSEVLEALLKATWELPVRSGANGPQLAAVERTVDDVVLTQLMMLASNEKASPEVRAVTLAKLEELKRWADAPATRQSEEAAAHRNWAVSQIRKFEQEPTQVLKPTEPLTPPPGQPIGTNPALGFFACDEEW